MNIRLSTCLAAIGCMLFASCYPVKEPTKDQPPTKAPEKSVTTAEAQKLKEQEAAKRKEKEKEKEKLAQENPPEKPDGTSEKPPTEKTTKPGGEGKRPNYPVAVPAPGKENTVLSPYNSKVISTLDENNKPIPSGTLVADPTYPPSEKKYFRVP